MKKLTFKSTFAFIFILSLFANNSVYSQTTHSDKFNFTDLNSPYVTCYAGMYYDPFAEKDIVDFGPTSQLSRHTVHTDTAEYDVRTGNKLKVIPDGESAVVRLGNWGASYNFHLNGGEAEAIEYSCTVTEENPVLLLNYAVIWENPLLTCPIPHFSLNVYDENRRIIIDECADIFPKYNSGSGWNTENNVVWKDWSSAAIGLQDYIGKNITIELINKDCGSGGHFGYTYFTLDFISDKIVAYGEGVKNFTAPARFTYEWADKNDPDVILSTQRTFSATENRPDTCICKLSDLDNPRCFIALEYTTAGAEYKVDFSHEITMDNCMARVIFKNQSYAHDTDISDFETYMWDFGNGETSNDKNPTVIYEPGTYPVSLTGIAGDSVITHKNTVIIPHFGPTIDTIHISIPTGTFYKYDNVIYNKPGDYEHIYLSHQSACDSTIILSLNYIKEGMVDFEGKNEIDCWEFSQTENGNPWIIGDGVKSEGNSSMYVTDESKKRSKSQNNTYSAVYRELWMRAETEYTITFDWLKAQNTGTLYACWIPSSAFTGKWDEIDFMKYIETYSKVSIAKDVPADPMGYWHSSSFDVMNFDEGLSSILLFCWMNTDDTNAGAIIAIDNLQIKPVTGSPIEELEYRAENENGIFSWVSDNNDCQYELMYKSLANSEEKWSIHEDITENSLSTAKLEDGTYKVWIRTVCDADTSTWYRFNTFKIASETVNLNTITNGVNVGLYPNPARKNTDIHIDLPLPAEELNGLTIEIYNLEGRCVYTETSSTQLTTIQPVLDEGIYILKITTNTNKTFNRKLVIQ